MQACVFDRVKGGEKKKKKAGAASGEHSMEDINMGSNTTLFADDVEGVIHRNVVVARRRKKKREKKR